MIRGLVILAAILAASLAARHAFLTPEAAIGIAATAATVLAVLASVSLAIFSVIATRSRSVSPRSDVKRVEFFLDKEDKALADQQLFVFILVMLSLGLCLAMKFFVSQPLSKNPEVWVRILASSMSFGVWLSVSLSLLLPSVLVGIIRRNHGV